MDPAAVRDRVDAWSAVPSSWDTPHTRIRPEELDERIDVFRTFDFAPDGTQLAFIGSGSVEGLPPGATDDVAGIVDLTGRTLSQLHTGFTYPLGYVAHLGSDTVAVAEYDPESFLATADVDHTMRIHLADHNGVRTEPGFGAGEILALERVAGDRSFIVSTDRPAGCTVLTADSDVPPAGLGGVDGIHPRATAVDPEGRLIAVFDDNEGVLVRLGGAEANRLPKGADGSPRSNATWQAALSPATLISCDFEGRLHVWHDPLTAVGPPATTGPRLRYGKGGLLRERPSAVFWSPALNRFLAVTRAHLQLLDVPPTRDEHHPVSASIALVGSQDAATEARLSPRGDVLAVDDKHNAINLYALGVLTLPPFVARPLGLMTRHNLADVIAVEQNPALDQESRAVLTLLRACLEHRFRHDIGIGVPPDAPPGDAIALGETRGERGYATDAHRPLE
ncbi:hypothetical protein QQY66_37825 [Streptomyces sp. DG2A-72]|uniref:hypothetical protein n=1 Tax=Streptomyces sp. DG2A-72 TaxID=3051386 RepID=UPI00265BB7CC|nr:hypothetical protein [Streptomyces sp. DG2A-72]MDO0937201.1 hypothetical protein [Streptomyces sp. DG2A-72]